MKVYVLRRLAQSALTLLGVSVLVFVILRVLPGNPARMLLPEGAPESAVEDLNRQLGLREPLIVQYGIFLRSVVRGDFGQSFQYRAPALTVVLERLPATIQLSLVAMLLTVAFGVSLGILAAVRRGTRYDVAGMILAVLGQSLPNFWLGIMLILFFGVALRWLPTSGFSGLDVAHPARHHPRRLSRPPSSRASRARACSRSSTATTSARAAPRAWPRGAWCSATRSGTPPSPS